MGWGGSYDLLSDKEGQIISLWSAARQKGKDWGNVYWIAFFVERNSGFCDLPWGKEILVSVACLGVRKESRRQEGWRRSERNFHSEAFTLGYHFLSSNQSKLQDQARVSVGGDDTGTILCTQFSLVVVARRHFRILFIHGGKLEGSQL